MTSTTTSFLTQNSTTPSDIEAICNQYYQNSTIFITKDYGGIPENLVINVCAWFALLILYTFLRRIGDYGRFGLIKSSEERRNIRNRRYSSSFTESWTSKFFGQRTSLEGFTTLSDNEQTIVTNSMEEANRVSNEFKDLSHSEEYKDEHFYSWIVHMFKLKDQHIKDKSGEDALYYLVFQRYLIVYLSIITVLSLVILLPLNIYTGSEVLNFGVFSRTTIINIKAGSSTLWVHLFLSWIFLLVGFIFVRLFSKRMSYTEGDYVSRTVLITNYPTKFCSADIIYQHFKEAYPELIVNDIQFAYDVNKLSKLHSEKSKMKIGRLASEKIFEQTNQRPMMHPFHFGSLFELCCCCCHRCFKDNNKKITDSIDFYSQHENKLNTHICTYKERVLKNPLGIVFVTFENKSMAEQFLKDYKLGFFGAPLRSCLDKSKCSKCYLCKQIAKQSSISENIRSDKWHVKYATSPSNIKWENISKYGINWWFRVFLINVVLFIVMIFFTTPAILLDKLTEWGSFINYREIEKYLPGYLAEFLPSLMLRLFAALMPVLVALTALAELHWTRSAENRSMMTKTFLLLIFMVLILPTLGLTSVNAVFQWFKDKSNVKWQCVSDNGAFFIKYVTTCSLIGTALDLLRIPELLLYLIRLLWSRSSAERLFVRMKVAFEFDYGVQYAWMITVFTVTLCFSVVCPLITPFGLVYLVMKHLVDRYNIYFAYVPTKVDKRIHKTAITFTIAAFIMLQFCIFFFIAVKNKNNINTNAMFSVQILIIVLSCILFFGRIFFGFFKRFSPFDSAPIMNFDVNESDNSDTTRDSSADMENDQKKIIVNQSVNDTSTNDIDANIITEQPSPNQNQKSHQLKNIQKKLFPSTKRKGVPSNGELQSPFIPSLLRSPSIENFKLRLLNSKKINDDLTTNSNADISRPETPGDVHIELEDDLESSTESKSNSSPRASYGALGRAENLIEIIDNQTGLANKAFNNN